MKSYLQIAKLGEGFVAAVEFANKGLGLTMRLEVCPDISTLGKSLPTLRAVVRFVPCVTPLVSLGNS